MKALQLSYEEQERLDRKAEERAHQREMLCSPDIIRMQEQAYQEAMYRLTRMLEFVPGSLMVGLDPDLGPAKTLTGVVLHRKEAESVELKLIVAGTPLSSHPDVVLLPTNAERPKAYHALFEPREDRNCMVGWEPHRR